MRLKTLGISIGSTVAAICLGTFPAYASTVSVQSGQTMWTISQSHHISLSSLESANPSINPLNLTVGTRLQIPNQQSSTYVVQSGDTFWTIARHFNVSVNSLEVSNPTVNSSNLLVGTRLVIPPNVNSASTAVGVNHTNSSIAQQNLYWMEHVINAEAAGEPLQAQIAVGDVILHRLDAGTYGSTVHDVVFQVINGHYQFTSVENGYIYSSPSAESIQAAKDVLQNQQDVVPGALVFYNPTKTSSSSWVWSQPTITKIGDLVFAK